MLKKINDRKIDFYQLINNSIYTTFVLKDRQVFYANQACLKLFHLAHPEEFLDKDITSFIHPDCIEKWEARLNYVRTKQQPLGPTEIKMIDSKGNIIAVDTVIDLFFHEEELLAQIIVIDITERKEAEKLLIQSEKLSTMGELAAGVVHEIRNPLTIISGFMEILRGETTDIGNQYISLVSGEVKRIEELANDLLAFSKPQQTNLKVYKITPIVKEAITLLENMALKKRVALNFYSLAEYITIKCNHVQMKQALINFIKNGIEATPENGQVDIIIKQYKNKLHLIISDTGCGLPKDKIKELGTSFFTTKEKGTGLGLMVTYNIIKNHEGTIEVNSEVGKGTTFIIELPCT